MLCNPNMIEEVIEIANAASKVILEVYNSDNFETEYKEDSSPLTVADQRASDLICDGLKRLTPNIPIICEETAQVDYEVRENWNQFWLVDPLDGTKEFVKKNGEFTVNIALIREKKPVLGVMAVPVMGLIYYAQKDQGAWRLEVGTGQRYKLECNPFKLDDPINVLGSRSHGNNKTDEFFELFDVVECMTVGSALKFAYMCENKAQIYGRMHPCMEWDIAASDIILREAGGSIWILEDDFETETEMWYNKPSLVNPSFAAFGRLRS